MQKDAAGRKLINGRYKLNACVFASDLGSVYLARDMRSAGQDSVIPDVLLHFLPNRTVGYTELPRLFVSLQERGADLDCALTPVIDYGWSGTVAYFVMSVSDSWSVNALPELQGTPSNLHRQAIQTTRDLMQQGVVNKGLVAQAFIVIPGGVYLLATALLEPFQQLQEDAALLPLQESAAKDKPVKWLPLIGWAGLAGGVVAGGGYAYYVSQQQAVLARTETPVAAPVQQQQPDAVAQKSIAESTVVQPAEPEVQIETPKEAQTAEVKEAEPVEATKLKPDTKTVPETVAVVVDKAIEQQKNEDEPLKKSGPVADVEQADSETLALESTADNSKEKTNVAEAEPVEQKQSTASSPNIEVSAAKPIVPEDQQQPLIHHSDKVEAEPVKIDPAPVPPELAELKVLENLPVNTIMLTPIKPAVDKPVAESQSVEGSELAVDAPVGVQNSETPKATSKVAPIIISQADNDDLPGSERSNGEMLVAVRGERVENPGSLSVKDDGKAAEVEKTEGATPASAPVTAVVPAQPVQAETQEAVKAVEQQPVNLNPPASVAEQLKKPEKKESTQTVEQKPEKIERQPQTETAKKQPAKSVEGETNSPEQNEIKKSPVANEITVNKALLPAVEVNVARNAQPVVEDEEDETKVAVPEPDSDQAEKSEDEVKSSEEKGDGDKTVEDKESKKQKRASEKEKGSPELTASGMTKNELVAKAYDAIKDDKLSEAAGKGAVYYIRLLKRIDRGNPQITRLAREVVSAYHVKARHAIRRKHRRAAGRLLWIAGRLIKEFNLARMNKAHEILKHRMKE